MSTRTISVSYLSRVAGEGALTIAFEGERAKEVRLDIFEPPRFIEGILRGRSQMDAPDVTARICGICPFPHLTAAAMAIERAVGVAVEGPIRDLRRLIHCGSFIESHALHVWLLHLPDFLGCDDVVQLAARHRDLVRAGLRMKKAGNALCAAVGGREIHPVNLRVGGFYRAPHREELLATLPELEWGLEAALAAVPFLAGLPYPDFDRDYELVALRHPREYPFFEGRIASTSGLDFEPEGYDDHVIEEHVQRSNALHSIIRGRGAFLTGPLARLALSFDRLSPMAKVAARQAGIGPGLRNPFKSILARTVEMVHCFEEAISLVRGYREPGESGVEVARRAATGSAAVEAPRGLLLHSYDVGADGLIRKARIVVPTSHNLRAIEEDLFLLAPRLARASTR